MLPEAHARYQACDYAGVVELLGRLPRESLLAEPAEAVLLAHSARRVGGVDDLLEFVDETVEAARARDPAILCDALNLRGGILFERGRVQAAERTWCDLVDVATTADEPQFVARASNNLGVAAILSMRLESAIGSFHRAVSAYLRLSHARGLAQSHTNLGIIYREMDHEQETYANFQRALTWAHAAEADEELARIEGELALYHLYLCKDVNAAQSTAQQALDRYTSLGQPIGVAHVTRVLGLIAIARGQFDAAEELLDRALATAVQYNIKLLQGETLLALAANAQWRGALPRKFNCEEQAREIFAGLSAEPWGAQVAMRMQQLGR